MSGTGNSLAQELLARAHSPGAAERLFNERVVQKPLYVRPSSPEPSARALRRRALAQRKEKAKKRSTQKPRPLSAAQKRKLGLLEIPKAQAEYAIYKPLHHLWLSYMKDILGVAKPNGSHETGNKVYVSPLRHGPLLASADMHGALLEVVRSRCVSRVGLKGIVVKDSKFLFEIITEKNCIKCK